MFIFSETTIGNHHAGVKCVEHCTEANVMITGSWDSTIKIWDSRTNECVGTYSQPDKVNI